MSDPADGDQSEKKLLTLAGLLAPTDHVIPRGSADFREVVEALPAAIYITDADGVITYYNDAAAQLWGWRPELGKNQWCGSWKLFWPDGRALPHDQCPMALA
jgi:PAS domain-containing protein